MGVRILIADDDPSILTMLATLLKPLGIEEPLTASNGVDALRIFREHEFDLVLVDWQMPQMSGLDVLAAIRANGYDTPVVMITSMDLKSQVRQALEAGATDYIVKPFDPDSLRRKVVRLCRPMAPSVDAGIYRAGSVMNEDVFSIHEDTTLVEAIDILLDREFSGLPVVDEEQHLVGVITEFLLARTIYRPEIRHLPVADVMTRDLITVTEDTLLSEVVVLMEENRIRRIPVVRDGRLVGLIARRDLLRHAREHAEAITEFLSIIRAAGGG